MPEPVAPSTSAPSESKLQPAALTASAHNLTWVWQEVRKRVFIKLPFSRPVAEALEKVVPLSLEGEALVCGLATQDYHLSKYLVAGQVRNTIESILHDAAKHRILFDLIEGSTIEDWLEVKARRTRAHDAVVSLAEKSYELHNFEAVLNQIVTEIRQRVTATPDRMFPQVRAALLLEIVPLLADTADMLFPDRNTHDARRAMTRAIDRVAIFLDIPALTIAIEIEHYFKDHTLVRRTPPTQAVDA